MLSIKAPQTDEIKSTSVDFKLYILYETFYPVIVLKLINYLFKADFSILPLFSSFQKLYQKRREIFVILNYVFSFCIYIYSCYSVNIYTAVGTSQKSKC